MQRLSKFVTALNNRSIVKLFEEQVEKNPHNIAIIKDNIEVPYIDLNKKANIFSAHLSKLGVKKGDIVVVCMAKSIEQIISIISILKLGALYLPLSSEITRSRLNFVHMNSGFKFAIYDVFTYAKFTFLDNVLSINAIEINNEPGNFKEKPNQFRQNDVTVSSVDPAYIIYTSGTTGAPKGVIAPHGGVIRLVKDQNYIEITSKDTFLLLSPVEFDASSFEIWGPLLNGAKLILMPPGFPELNTIARFIEKYKVSILFLTTQLFNSLVDLHLEALNKVEKILFGGERASVTHVQKFMKNNGSNKLLCNIYGPTECTTFSTFYEIKSSTLQCIPIGKNISNTFTVVLDEENNIVKEGEIGELHIGGPGLFLGYLNDESLTNQKIIEYVDEVKNKKYKLFKSGDLVKVLDDQNYEFIGRIDRQIKVRGFRVYLEEIENSLREYKDIKDVSVIALEQNHGVKLIAFLLVCQKDEFKLSELKDYFFSHHPAYMYPNKHVFIDSIPLNASGKIAYDKLTETYETDLGIDEIKKVVSRQTDELSDEIIKIWKNELSCEDITVYDDFFDLGGHSLIIMNILSKLHQQSKFPELKKLSAIDLFKFSNVDSLVTHIKSL
jgi:bacitracin synthase 3